MARAAKDAAEAAEVAEAAKANMTKANGAMPKIGVSTCRRRRFMAKETGAEKAIGDNSSCSGAHSSLHPCRPEKVKAGLRLQVHGARGRPRSVARLAVSFPLAGRQKFRSTGAARIR